MKRSTLKVIARRMAKILRDLRGDQIEILLRFYWNEVVKDLLEGKKIQVDNFLTMELINNERNFYNPQTKEIIRKKLLQVKVKPYKTLRDKAREKK